MNTDPYSRKELERCLEFIIKTGTIEKPNKPIQILATEVMLCNFRWPNDGPSSQGYKRARAVILALENQGKIECDWSPGKRLLAIRLKKGDMPTEPDTRQIPSQLKDESPPPDELTSADRENAAMRRALAQMKPRGWAARNADIIRRGDRNEDWAHASFIKLLEILTREFPKIVLNANCHRSGRHNPSKGKIDLQDHYGEDFSLRLITRHPNGPIINGYIIYDSKGSRRDVQEFNADIIYHPGQNGALMKRAIWANAKLTLRKDFAREVVSDCIVVGLLPRTFNIAALLDFFED